MDSSRIYKVSNVALALILCLLPILGYWAIHVRYGTALVEEWLPKNDQVVASYHRFVEHFGHDQFLLISWPDCDLEDARLPIFAEQLLALRQQHPEYRILTVNHSLQAVEQLTNSPLNFTEPEAIERLQGIALGKNLTCFVTLQLGFAPAEMRTQLLDAIAAIAVAEFNFSPEELILAGEPLQVSIIDRASRETMQYWWPGDACEASV